jgi:hypothetical protein
MSAPASALSSAAWRRPSPGRPNIRLIIEFAEGMLAHTVTAPQFVDDIHSLGFRICRILPECRLQPVGLREAIGGFNNCLLTRTPEADIATVERRRNAPLARFKRWWSRRPHRVERYRRRWHRL